MFSPPLYFYFILFFILLFIGIILFSLAVFVLDQSRSRRPGETPTGQNHRHLRCTFHIIFIILLILFYFILFRILFL